MTPQEISDASRNNLNALQDTFWTDTEILGLMYQTMLEMARQTNCIDTIDTSVVSVNGQADYTKPTGMMEIWRITYNGAKLQRIDLREFDSINPNNNLNSGTPFYYLEYDSIITLYPTPDTAALQVKIWAYSEPVVPTAGSTLEIPTTYHDAIIIGTTFRMCPKETAHPLTEFWKLRWTESLAEVKAHVRRKKRGDKFAVVLTEENTLQTQLGII